MSLRLFALDAAQISETWPDYAHLFERFAEARGDIGAEQVRELAEAGHMQVWGLQDHERVHAVVTTEICAAPVGKICVVRIASGGAPVAMQERLLDEIGKWARESQGCDKVRLYGRRGWLRRFPRFRPTGVIADWNLRTH